MIEIIGTGIFGTGIIGTAIIGNFVSWIFGSFGIEIIGNFVSWIIGNLATGIAEIGWGFLIFVTETCVVVGLR